MSKKEDRVALDEESYRIHWDVRNGKYGKDDPSMDRYRRMDPEDYRPKGFWAWLTGRP